MRVTPYDCRTGPIVALARERESDLPPAPGVGRQTDEMQYRRGRRNRQQGDHRFWLGKRMLLSPGRGPAASPTWPSTTPGRSAAPTSTG